MAAAPKSPTPTPTSIENAPLPAYSWKKTAIASGFIFAGILSGLAVNLVALLLFKKVGPNDGSSPSGIKWTGIGINTAFNVLCLLSIPLYLARGSRLLSRESHPMLKAFAYYGKNWLNAGVLVNIFRDFNWAWFSSGTNMDPYVPYRISFEDAGKLCGMTAAFSFAVYASQAVFLCHRSELTKAKAKEIAWDFTKVTAGALLGLAAWNIAPWAFLAYPQFGAALGIVKNLAVAYRIAGFMGLGEGPVQFMCTEFPEIFRGQLSKLNIFLKTFSSPLAGTAWDISDVAQGIGFLTEASWKLLTLTSVNLGLTVGAFNAFFGALGGYLDARLPLTAETEKVSDTTQDALEQALLGDTAGGGGIPEQTLSRKPSSTDSINSSPTQSAFSFKGFVDEELFGPEQASGAAFD